MTKNILIITQKVDENDDLLGFFVGWLKEFAKRFDNVFVITLMKGEHDLPKNVFIYSLGKENGSSRISRIFNFYKFLFRLIPKSDGVFAHMSPVFVIASWPAAFIFRKKIVLWYLHRSVTARLKLAEKFCYKIVTSIRESLNLKSGKIVELGHGIDIKKFKFDRKFDDFISRPIEILSVGRISPIKNYETLIRAAEVVNKENQKLKIKIIGRPIMKSDASYFRELKKLVKELRLEGPVEFKGFVPYKYISDYYKKSDLTINMAPTGGLDKAVLEAMASGCIILVSNTAFQKYIDDKILFFEYGNHRELAEKIILVSQMPSDRIKELRERLFNSVARYHNLSELINKISSLYG